MGSWNITSVSDRSCSGSSDTVSLLHGCAALQFEQLVCCPSSISNPSDKPNVVFSPLRRKPTKRPRSPRRYPDTISHLETPNTLAPCLTDGWGLSIFASLEHDSWKSDCPGRLILILVSRRRVRQCSWLIEGSDIEADNILAVPTSSWSTAVHEKPLQPVIFRVTKMLYVRAYHSHWDDPHAPSWLSPPPNGRKFCREFHNACDTWLPITNPVYSPCCPFKLALVRSPACWLIVWALLPLLSSKRKGAPLCHLPWSSGHDFRLSN